MNTIAKLTFVLFYAASSFAVTQKQAVLTVEEFLQCSSVDHQSSIDTFSSPRFSHFPQYRQAKPKARAGLDLHYCLSTVVSRVPDAPRPLSTGVLSRQRILSFDNILSRPPPLAA